MKKRFLAILLSLAVTVSMCIPCTAFAENEGTTNITITVCEPVAGQPYHEGYTIDGIDYTMELQTSARSSTCGYFNYMHTYQGGSAAMHEGTLFDYDSTYEIEAAIMCPSMDRPFTGSYTATVNGHPADVSVSEDNLSISISYVFKTGSREPIEDIYLDGYKPVKVGTTPARLSKSAADTEGNYTATGYYTDFYMAQSNEIHEFKAGTDYYMHIYVEAPYSYTFSSIKPENIHIEGYDMPDEGVELWGDDGSLGGRSSYLVINLPAGTAEENIYEFTVPEPKEGSVPGNAALKANDDITCTGIDWYKSPDDWFYSSDTVKMEDGDKFEAGYDYFAQPQFSWKGEELAPGSFTIKVNGDTYNGNYYEFGHLYREVDLKITVNEPKIGGTPAQTFSANIPISEQVCAWYLLPNAPSTDGAQPMESTDTFKIGGCYALVPVCNFDYDTYEINKTYVNGVDISKDGFMMFGPIKYAQSISCTSSFSKKYGDAAFKLGASAKTALSYKSSNTAVATVSSDGTVTIKGAGTAKITITAAETDTYKGAVKTVSVNVAAKAQTITGVNASYTKAYGSAFTLKPASKTARTYKSSNKKIATVSSAGKVTIKGVGTAKITITATENTAYKKATKTIKIKAVPKKAVASKATPGKKKLTVKMGTKVASTGGATYQIAYKQKGTSKWKYTTTTKQSKVISKLKKGKRYYVKVRAYKTVSKVKYYGAWSKTKLSNKIK